MPALDKRRPSVFDNALSVVRRIATMPEIDSRHPQYANMIMANNYRPRCLMGEIFIDSPTKANEMASAIGRVLRTAIEDQHIPNLKVTTIATTDSTQIPTRYVIGVAIGNTDRNVPTPPDIPVQQLVLAIESLRKEMFGTSLEDVESSHWQMTVMDLNDGHGMIPAYKWEAKTPREEYLLDLMKKCAEIYGVPCHYTPRSGKAAPSLCIAKEDLVPITVCEIVEGPRR